MVKNKIVMIVLLSMSDSGYPAADKGKRCAVVFRSPVLLTSDASR
jgi:hypothetical protein